jgi:UDP-2,3-diacylglucosamine hydrolase
MPIHLISDLHLADTEPQLTELFRDTLSAWCGQIDALYILGDLFEYWVGDDDDSLFNRELLAAMQQFSARTPLYVMRGNRDFLLGDEFARQSGAQLIEDPTQITCGAQRYLLAHGDALCSDDHAYQQFRQQSRNPAWQQAMLARPLAERHAIARQAREVSEASKLRTGMNPISDVTDSAVIDLLQQYDWPLLVHGHTHRPACHPIEHQGHQSQRWVIADWHHGHGGYLRLDQQGISAHPL